MNSAVVEHPQCSEVNKIKILNNHIHTVLLCHSYRLWHIEAVPIWNSGGKTDVSVSAKIHYARKGDYFAASAGGAVQIVGPKGWLPYGYSQIFRS